MTTTSAGLDRRLVEAWRRDWDAMMAVYLPDGGAALSTVFATAERGRSSRPLRVLDLGGGPGTTAERVLRRWPTAEVTLVDIDPVLLALARATLSTSAVLVDADLATPAWTTAVTGEFDLVLAVMTLHYFPPRRIQALYREIRALLRPRGTLLVVDGMPQPRAPASEPEGPGFDSAWRDWWQSVRAHPAMAPLLARRAELLGERPVAEFTAPAAWHCAAAQAAGFAEATVRWRHGSHAAVAAVA